MMMHLMKRRRLDRGCDPVLYPPIPESCQDSRDNRIFDEMVVVGGFKKTDETTWGSPEVAAAKALVTEIRNESDERLVRSYHPALASEWHVHILRDMSGNKVWVVLATENSNVSHTEAGGWPIHLAPGYYNPFPRYWNIPRTIPIRRLINPRRMLTADDIDIIRSAFPTSIGIRIFISGLAIVIFQDKKTMVEAWKDGTPGDVGGLVLGFDILSLEPSTVAIHTGYDVAREPESLDCRGCLGLKIELENGDNAISTVTHGFVKLPDTPKFFLDVAEWISCAKQRIRKFISPKNFQTIPGQLEVWGDLTNSAMGQVVYLAGEAQEVGAITRTYDQPSNALPYPAGYRHDLSLITGDNLPHVVSPPGVGKVSSFANYEDALDGKPVFMTRFDAYLNKNRLQPGKITTKATKKAVVEGTQYLWISRAASASILWRTSQTPPSMEYVPGDYFSATGYSGSVLCLGNPSDDTIQALVFQNFETPVRAWQIEGEEALSGNRMKGGFLLPTEIRHSTIVHDAPEWISNFHSHPTRGTLETSDKRKSISDYQ